MSIGFQVKCFVLVFLVKSSSASDIPRRKANLAVNWVREYILFHKKCHPREMGVLFLDECPEFVTRVIGVMRQPMEDKVVTISRPKGSLIFSANFQLIAAMNPCPCGFYGDTQKPCTCAPVVVTKYQTRISGPLLDHIDIHIEVPRVDKEDTRTQALYL